MRFFRWLCGSLRRLFRRKPLGLRAEFLAEAPETLAPNVVYIECEGDNAWLAAMRCPCGCGARVSLNLLADAEPCWTVEVDADGTPSVYPSVWRTAGCKSHFFIRRGQIDWC